MFRALPLVSFLSMLLTDYDKVSLLQGDRDTYVKLRTTTVQNSDPRYMNFNIDPTSSHINQRMLTWTTVDDLLEDWTEDNLVSFELSLLIRDERDVFCLFYDLHDPVEKV